VGLFRRREPLHEKLAREGGLTQPPDLDPRPRWQEAGVHGLARPREWDATVTAEAPGVGADEAVFVVLRDKTVLVEEGGDESLEPLAAAVEESLEPPYRARASRQSETLWAVQARRIRVLEIPDGPAGDTIELITTPEGTTLTVDDAREFGSIPALEGLGDVVRATRLDGDLWEIQVEKL
jgi:hypothetical protein